MYAGSFISNLVLLLSSFKRLGILCWSQFYDSGLCGKVCGIKSKVIVFSQGNLTPYTINQMQQFKRYQVVYSGKMEFILHQGIVNLFKEVEFVMSDKTQCPPCKFTTLLQEYLNL